MAVRMVVHLVETRVDVKVEMLADETVGMLVDALVDMKVETRADALVDVKVDWWDRSLGCPSDIRRTLPHSLPSHSVY